MKTELRVYSLKEAEELIVRNAVLDHGFSLVSPDEWGLSAWYDYRTENEVRSSRADFEMSWKDIAQNLGTSNAEYATDEDGNGILLTYNED